MVLGATSCANNDTTEEILPAEGAISFVGELAASRTELGESNKVMWNADDKIRIYTQENTAGASFAGAATEATPTTTFTTTEAFATSNTGYFAVYSDKTYFNENWSNDWSAKEASYNNGVWSVPVKMQGAQYEGLYIPKDSYLEENNFMVAYSEDNKLSFKAATAMIKFVHTGAETWGSFRATGADLTGAATLNYNTATGEISYTTEGDETYIDFEATEAGQTCYLPIYPGTVNGFELYDGQTLIAKYDGEITFKAGVIYNMDIENMPALPVVSPYSVKVCSEGYAAGESYDMEVVGSFHVAKNVPNNPTGYGIFSTDSPWFVSYSVAAAGNVALYTWTSVGPFEGSNINFDCNRVDIYFSPETMQICIAAAGMSIPSLYHLYAYNSSAWSKVNAYVWDAAGTTLNGSWPGKAMTKTKVGEVEYYAYDIPNEYIGQNINFIFNNGTAQTADLSAAVNGDLFYYTNGDVVEDPANPVVAASHSIYVKNTANWSPLYLYGWGGLETAGWPGTKMTKTTIGTDTYYVYTYTGLGDVEGGSIIFNNGSGTQTADITGVDLDKDLFFEVFADKSYKKLDDPRQ